MQQTFLFIVPLLIGSFLSIDTIGKMDSVIGLRHDYMIVYPISSDSIVKNEYGVRHPTLVINNIIITDEAMIDCFQIHFQDLVKRKMISKPKIVNMKKAQLMGIQGVSKDGALIIKTKKNCYLDLSKCIFNMKGIVVR